MTRNQPLADGRPHNGNVVYLFRESPHFKKGLKPTEAAAYSRVNAFAFPDDRRIAKKQAQTVAIGGLVLVYALMLLDLLSRLPG